MVVFGGPFVSVCIPTYRRPLLLYRCLTEVAKQASQDLRIETVVVDNDPQQSARSVVEAHQVSRYTPVRYLTEPEPNISGARNRALAYSRGEYVAFIDDDEFPEPGWLRRLLCACIRFRSDGVLGPVLPHFAAVPPTWLVRSGLCVRESFPTGTSLENPTMMRTGNVLIARRVFKDASQPFDPRLGRTGGEDILFFADRLRAGYRFVWCNEARVYEEVPLERQTRAYYLRRALLRGGVAAGRERLLSRGTAKSVLAIAAYGSIMPVVLLSGRHLSTRYLVKLCDHISKLLAHLNIRLARERRE